MTKYVDNSFHALKVGFANEIGAICASLGLDSHAVMDIFLADTKLNISPAYLRPGFAFGGSCLPKDVRALTHTARQHDVDLPVLGERAGLQRDAGAPRRRPRDGDSAAARWASSACRSSRAPTICARARWSSSPSVSIGKGYDVRIYDSNVALSRLIGANRAYIEEQLPHIGELLTGDIDDVLAHGEVFIAGTSEPRGRRRDRPRRSRADGDRPRSLARRQHAPRIRPGYVGIGW